MKSKIRFSRAGITSIAIELTLTFTGVLAALAVENFRESLVERGREKEYLVAFRDALQSDTAIINVELQRSFFKLNAATRLIARIDKHDSSSQATLGEDVQAILMLIDPAYNTAVYEDLKATGNSRIIQNIALRNAIIAHYLYLSKLITLQQNSIPFISYNRSFMDQFTYEEFSLPYNLDDEKIMDRFRGNQDIQHYLRSLQKDMIVYRNSLIYSALPRTLVLLEQVEVELED